MAVAVLAKPQPRSLIGMPDAFVPINRANEADLIPKAEWLMPKLRTAYPGYTDAQIINFLRGCIASNEWLFITSENAVLLAQQVHKPMRVMRVDEEFVLYKDDEAHLEAVELYKEFKRWAMSQGAAKMVVHSFSDLPLDSIRSACGGKVKNFNIAVCELEVRAP